MRKLFLIVSVLVLLLVGIGVALLWSADIPAPRKTLEIPLPNDRLTR